ncbi:MAG: hypothetical protein LC664_08050 [Flavobacteriales bacterium]|nr:hypothetical protein [Flavobacteriales bacterium]
MLVVPTGILLLLGVLKGWRDGNNALKRGKWYALIGASLVANLLVLWPLMQPYTKRAIPSSYEHYQQIVHTIPTIKSYFYSTRGSVVWEFFSDMNVQIQMWGQHQLFSGGVATVCLFLGFIWVVATLFRSNWRIFSLSTTQMLLITGLITFILFLRIDRVSAYLALYYIPGFSSLRSLTRIINIQLLFFAISVSFVFAAILKKSGKRNTVVFLLALGVLVLDNSFDGNGIFRKSKSEARERVSVLDDALSRIPDGSVFSYEPTNPDDLPIHHQLDAMLASQRHNLKTVNGYTATSPVEFSFYWHDPNAPNRNYWLSSQNLEFDSLFVVESPDSTHTVTPSEIQSSMSDKVQYEFGVRQMIRVIKSDSGWMESIRKKAEKQKIPVDSMIVLDAIWMVKNNE